VIYIESSLPLFTSDNLYRNNTAFYGNVFASYAIRLALKVIDKGNKTIYDSLHKNHSLFTLFNEYPGIYMQKQLNFEALDHFNQTVTVMNERFLLVFIHYFYSIV